MKLKFNYIIITSFILFLMILWNYMPQMITKVIDRVSYFLDMRTNYLLVENWQDSQEELKLELKIKSKELSTLATNLPKEQEPEAIISVIGTLMNKYGINNHDLEYLEREKRGKYLVWPVKFKFKAHYLNGIDFLNEIERNPTLMRIRLIKIENKKNLRNRELEFITELELILIDA
jgi:Tfp pilus assembly protein PilO